MIRRARVLVFVILVIAIGDAAAAGTATLDVPGVWQDNKTFPTGWFRTERVEGRWWLVDPSGHLFLSVGVNHVSPRPHAVEENGRISYHNTVRRKYANERRWAEVAVRRLRGWGFNTLGARSSEKTWQQAMPYTVILNLSDLSEREECQLFPDVFDPEFESAVIRHARRVCRPLADDPALVGYFSDDELWWGGKGSRAGRLLGDFLQRDDSAPGRQALLNFLERRYLNIDELNEVWDTHYESFRQIGRIPQVGSSIPRQDEVGFMRLVAGQYFRVAHDAIRAVDEHHLILGCRFAGHVPMPVLEGMREHVDVVSVNHYGSHAPEEMLRAMHRTVGKPVLISEFSFRARDSGLPNERGAGVIVDTQGERAEHFERYVRELMALPMVVGYHWFEHCDRPAEGGVNGETSNCGLVNVQDEPYAELVEAVTRVNHSVYELAAKGVGPAGEM